MNYPTSADAAESQDYYNNSHAPEPHNTISPHLAERPPPAGPKPYLGLRARLSQIWINRWTILLLLVLFRVLMSIASMNDNIGDAREKALSACTKVESAGSALASMPYYMSKGVNELTATGVEKAVNGLMRMLELTITGVQEIIIFYINMLIGTYLCLITLVVNGAIEAATKLVEKVTEFLNKMLPDIGSAIKDGVGAFSSVANDVIQRVNSIPFVDAKIPELNIDEDLKKLDNIKIPSDFLDDMNGLKDKIPNFDEVQDAMNDIIRIPFGKIKELIRGEMDTYTFDRSTFPVPQKEELSFCSEGNGLNNFFDDLVELLSKGKKIFLAVIVVLAILVCAPMAWLEKKRFDKEEETIRQTEQSYKLRGVEIDPRDLVYSVSRPNTSGFGRWLSHLTGRPHQTARGARRAALTRWVVAYATSPPALFIISLAVAGIFSSLCQYLVLRAVESQVPDMTDQVADFTEKVTLTLDNASRSWQNGTNVAIKTASDNINEKVFGWVDESTGAVNETLNVVVEKVTGVITKAFGDSFLGDAVLGVVDCLVLNKIEGVQQGLTWVHDNAHISFPLVPADTFSLGALASMSNSTSDDELLLAPGDKVKSELSELLDKLIKKFESGIIKEAAISAAILSIWIAIFIIGVIWAIFKGMKADDPEAILTQNDFNDPPEDHARAFTQQDQVHEKQQEVHSGKSAYDDDTFNSSPPAYQTGRLGTQSSPFDDDAIAQAPRSDEKSSPYYGEYESYPRNPGNYQ